MDSKLKFNELMMECKEGQLKPNLRIILPILLAILLLVPVTRAVTLQVLSDAFLQVSVFVFASLALYYSLTRNLDKERLASYMQRHPLQEVAIAALLGALPGCGGAIIVVTQFTRGMTSFGAVVAVLTSTMGDAAFLLLAQKPADALLIVAISLVVGAISGYIVNLFHKGKTDWLLSKVASESKESLCGPEPSRTRKTVLRWSVRFWKVIFIPALIGAVAVALQLELNEPLNLPSNTVETIAATVTFLILVLWAFTSDLTGYSSITSEEPTTHHEGWLNKSVLDTQFVTGWVVLAFLAFEIPVQLFGLDVVGMFNSWGPMVVLMAVVIGFLPGCGPQILVTSLYINGSIPFSAQLGNAISNDGDALFPAIALAPKAALLATLYSAIPAFVAAYGFYFLFE